MKHFFEEKLQIIQSQSNLRELPSLKQKGHFIDADGKQLLNLSSNDYLGLASNLALRDEFLSGLHSGDFIPSASSSRLLTGNHEEYQRLETDLCNLFHAEAALVFNSGYHANMGILPAIADSQTLILSDKLVHASLIDGIRLSSARSVRYRHNDYEQLEQLLRKEASSYRMVIVVTESIFSMDGDQADLPRLVALKKEYPNVLLYVDEAHAIGVRGHSGLGCAEESGCIGDIDLLVGTFGKALASVGAYLICSRTIRDYLVNTMRTLIFTTGLPPVNLKWTRLILSKLASFDREREQLSVCSRLLREQISNPDATVKSSSHIIPYVTGDSATACLLARELQKTGYYVLPVRPPTVPEGTSRLRFSLTAALTASDTALLGDEIKRIARQNSAKRTL